MFVVDPPALADALDMGFTPGRAILHRTNFVNEFGVIGNFAKPGRADDPVPPVEVSYSLSRAPAAYLPLAAPVWW